MSSAYFAPLVTVSTVINAPGMYVTRCGEVVTIHAVSSRHDFGCHGAYPNGTAESWHRSGRLFASQETTNDIVAPAPSSQSAAQATSPDGSPNGSPTTVRSE